MVTELPSAVCSCVRCGSMKCLNYTTPCSCNISKQMSSKSLHKNPCEPTLQEQNHDAMKPEHLISEKFWGEVIYDAEDPVGMSPHNEIGKDYMDDLNVLYESIDAAFTEIYMDIRNVQLKPDVNDLNAQVMDVYKDDGFSVSLQKDNHQFNIYNILQKIKEAYQACSCKICKCISDGYPAPPDLKSSCCCKPCECNECKKSREKNNYTLYNVCTSGIASVFKIFDKKNDCACETCECAICSDTEEATCNCAPCECVECKSLEVKRRQPALIIAPVEDVDPSGAGPCSCAPCECLHCRHGYIRPVASTSTHEISTGTDALMNPNCHCDLCDDENCGPTDADTCKCGDKEKVTRKPTIKDVKDFDIRRTLVSKHMNTLFDVDKKIVHDTMAMYFQIQDSYPKSGVKLNATNIDSAAPTRENFKQNDMGLEYNDNCKCSPCECLNCKIALAKTADHISCDEKPSQPCELFVDNYEHIDFPYLDAMESTQCKTDRNKTISRQETKAAKLSPRVWKTTVDKHLAKSYDNQNIPRDRQSASTLESISKKLDVFFKDATRKSTKLENCTTNDGKSRRNSIIHDLLDIRSNVTSVVSNKSNFDSRACKTTGCKKIIDAKANKNEHQLNNRTQSNVIDNDKTLDIASDKISQIKDIDPLHKSVICDLLDTNSNISSVIISNSNVQVINDLATEISDFEKDTSEMLQELTCYCSECFPFEVRSAENCTCEKCNCKMKSKFLSLPHLPDIQEPEESVYSTPKLSKSKVIVTKASNIENADIASYLEIIRFAKQKVLRIEEMLAETRKISDDIRNTYGKCITDNIENNCISNHPFPVKATENNEEIDPASKTILENSQKQTKNVCKYYIDINHHDYLFLSETNNDSHIATDKSPASETPNEREAILILLEQFENATKMYKTENKLKDDDLMSKNNNPYETLTSTENTPFKKLRNSNTTAHNKPKAKEKSVVIIEPTLETANQTTTHNVSGVNDLKSAKIFHQPDLYKPWPILKKNLCLEEQRSQAKCRESSVIPKININRKLAQTFGNRTSTTHKKSCKHLVSPSAVWDECCRRVQSVAVRPLSDGLLHVLWTSPHHHWDVQGYLLLVDGVPACQLTSPTTREACVRVARRQRKYLVTVRAFSSTGTSDKHVVYCTCGNTLKGPG